MLEVFKLLHIKHDMKKCDLEEMKKTVKEEIEEQSSGSGKYLNGTTVSVCVHYVMTTLKPRYIKI